MVRPIAFDPEDVAERALAAFWQRGYDGCAISDLTAACGINRQSLYNHFGDKRGAFCAALARYLAMVDQAVAPLGLPEAGRPELESFVRNTLALQQKMDTGACLLVITAFSPQIADPDIRLAVDAGATGTRAAFADLLAQAGVEDPAASAAYVYAMMSGLSALARTGATRREIDATLRHALDTVFEKENVP
jgi:AcrR family transcriptional regulator